MPRYRTVTRVARIGRTGKITPAQAQYLARRALRASSRGTRGGGGAKKVQTNYANPVTQDGERIN